MVALRTAFARSTSRAEPRPKGESQRASTEIVEFSLKAQAVAFIARRSIVQELPFNASEQDNRAINCHYEEAEACRRSNPAFVIQTNKILMDKSFIISWIATG